MTLCDSLAMASAQVRGVLSLGPIVVSRQESTLAFSNPVPIADRLAVIAASGRASSKLWAGRRTASSVGTHCHADDSALRGCHESRGTRHRERHSGTKTQAGVPDETLAHA